MIVTDKPEGEAVLSCGETVKWSEVKQKLSDEIRHTGRWKTYWSSKQSNPAPTTARDPVTLHTQTLFPAHNHVYWATFNMPEHFPRVERQTGRLSDCQSAVITFTAPHCSAAPQTPGKLPQPLTFPLEKKIQLCKWQLHGARFVDWNYYEDFFFFFFNKATEIPSISLMCHPCDALASWLYAGPGLPVIDHHPCILPPQKMPWLL